MEPPVCHRPQLRSVLQHVTADYTAVYHCWSEECVVGIHFEVFVSPERREGGGGAGGFAP